MEFETMYPFKSISSWLAQESSDAEWTREDNKRFESALAIYEEDTPDRWLKVAAMIPGKTVLDVVKQYKKLEQDIADIEAGRFQDPEYPSSSSAFEKTDNQFSDKCRKRPITAVKSPNQERKKWTEDEHKRFLMGLKQCGKGDWIGISRKYVITKTSTQVASHAQKYFLRQKLFEGKKNKRRHSIHDITICDLTETAPSDKDMPLLFNESHIPAPHQNVSSMPPVQEECINQPNDEELMAYLTSMGKQEWINHPNDGGLMAQVQQECNNHPNDGPLMTQVQQEWINHPNIGAKMAQIQQQCNNHPNDGDLMTQVQQEWINHSNDGKLMAYLTSMAQVQQEWINHPNDGAKMASLTSLSQVQHEWINHPNDGAQMASLTSLPQVQHEWINHPNDGALMAQIQHGWINDPNDGELRAYLAGIPQVQQVWVNHPNDGAPMGFNSNGNNMFEPSSSGISPNTLNLQGQDLHACANLNTSGKASRDFNKEASFGVHAL